MEKHRSKLKPPIIAAAVVAAAFATILTVNAAGGGVITRFFMGGEEREGNYRDYVDHDGFRHVSFDALIPIDEENYAIMIDVDAPAEEAVRVITDETDCKFMDMLRLRDRQSDPDNEELGLIFKDSEACAWHLHETSDDGVRHCGSGFLGEVFMRSGAAEGMPSEGKTNAEYDHESGTKIITTSFYYYVGKE